MKPSKKDSKPLVRTLPESTHKVIYGRPTNEKRTSRGFFAVFAIALFLLGISIGFVANDFSHFDDTDTVVQAKEFEEGKQNANIESETQIDYAQFWEVWNDIKKYHIDQDATDSELFYGALRGMVRSTKDPYSDYFTPEEAEKFQKELENGSFEGIGAEIGKKEGYLVVIAPLPNSPAQKAGLQAGDVILKIDDQDATEMSLEYAIYLIRGEKGTTVQLTIAREEEEEPKELSIERNTIEYKSVEWDLIERNNKKIIYIELRQFNQDAATLMQEAVNEFVLEKPDGIILDVRNNGGGVVDGAIAIASLFLDAKKTVLIEQRYDGKEETYQTEGNHPLGDIPTVVLMNGGSASASEIVAGALHDHARATLIGTTTFGKGTVQQLIKLSDDSLLKLTEARWLTPNGNQINEKGIEPDIVVERQEDDFGDEKDTQKDAALLYLVNREAFEKTYVNKK